MIDMAGKRFGLWTVISESGRDKWGQYLWLCQCDCGATGEIPGGRLRRGESKSCGCDKSRMCAEANIKHGAAAGGKVTVEYEAWSNAIDRCENPNNLQFKDWGGRGIFVCAKWRHDFAAFLADMGPKPTPAHSIDRVDNDGNYEPDNCRWATPIQQRQNRRSVRILEWNGQRHCIKEWSRIIGVKYLTLYMRLKDGWSVEKALSTPNMRTARAA